MTEFVVVVFRRMVQGRIPEGGVKMLNHKGNKQYIVTIFRIGQEKGLVLIPFVMEES